MLTVVCALELKSGGKLTVTQGIETVGYLKDLADLDDDYWIKIKEYSDLSIKSGYANDPSYYEYQYFL